MYLQVLYGGIVLLIVAVCAVIYYIVAKYDD